MVNEGNSPDPDISIHSPTRSMPQFTGLALPTPLLELQRKEQTASKTRHPSEFTALAIRLRNIRLDASPNSGTASNTPRSKNPTPVRLQFDDEDPALDKENVGMTPAAFESVKTAKGPEIVDKISDNPFLRPEHPESGDDAHEETSDQFDHGAEAILGKDEPKTCSDVPSSADGNNRSPSLDIAEEVPVDGADNIVIGDNSEQKKGVTDTPMNSSAPLHEEPEVPSSGNEVPTDAVSKELTKSTDCEEGQALHIEEKQARAPEPEALEPTESSATGINEDEGKAISTSSQQTDEQLGAMPATESSRPSGSQDTVREDTEFSATGNDVANESAQAHYTAQGESRDDTASNAVSKVEDLRATLGIVIDGESKWPWQKRCDAMCDVTRIISSTVSEEVRSTVWKVLPDLSRAINANLDELRPSVMSAALNLANAIIREKIDNNSDFAEQVFPSIMDLSCGRSITSQEGSRSVALLLHMHPELSNILEDADNPSRLQELLEADENSKLVEEEVNLMAKKATAVLRSIICTGDTSSPPNSKRVGDDPDGMTLSEKNDDLNKCTKAETVVPPASVLTEAPAASPRFSSRSVNARFSQRLNALSGSPIVSDKISHSRAARRSFHLTPGFIRSTHRNSFRLGSEGHPATPVVRNMKLGDTIRKVSPGSRSKRMYTEEDLEEARRAAIRVVMQEVSEAHAKEREKFQAEKAALEKQVTKEKSDVADLKSVLEEFELTMQKMVSEGNTQASAYCTALEKETKKLKAELLEATEAYETVKERYDTGKQALKIYENKEARSIEQIRELKRNMSELQKWSNELKANTEKKLAKAFENVTAYRASYLEMEARLSKAKSDLDRVRIEHEKEATNHKDTASTLARVEKSLHSEQDARSSVETSLSTTKASLSRMSAQKERLQRELSEAQDELKRLSAEVSKLRDADVRAKNASKQLESYAVERQSMKARAYDDMSRIRELEHELDVKDKEYNELNAIAEEALSQLEKMKMGA